jgi:hypothetical protein
MSGGRHEHEPSIADSFITVTEAQLAHLALEAETIPTLMSRSPRRYLLSAS